MDVVTSSPAIGPDGTIYFGSWDHKFYAVKPDGTKKWEFATGGAVSASPAIAADGTIYFGSENTLYALKPDGTKNWEFVTRGRRELRSHHRLRRHDLLRQPSQSKLYALKPDGKKKWEFATGDIVTSCPPSPQTVRSISVAGTGSSTPSDPTAPRSGSSRLAAP